MKIIINTCYGGFGVSEEWAKDHNIKDRYNSDILRHNTDLINAIEAGGKVNAPFSRLKVIEIPADSTYYEVEDYDGYEWIACVINGKIRHIY